MLHFYLIGLHDIQFIYYLIRVIEFILNYNTTNANRFGS